MHPQRFGPYLLLEHLATGGMGEVFLATRGGVAGFSKPVVVKRLREDLASDDEFVEMFLDEGRLAAFLDHSNIVHIYELGEHDDMYFMAMEYVHGIDLGSLLHHLNGPLEIAEALYIMRNVCEGLAFAHDAVASNGNPLRLVHRDINPQNVLISHSGSVKIVDFGIAKVAERHRQTRAGVLKGKFGYLSPEQARGKPIDRRCDVYALGLLLFEMTTGYLAIPEGPEAKMLEAAAHGTLEQPDLLVPGYPRRLADIFRKATAYRPEDRYQSVSTMLEELQEYQMDERLLITPKGIADLVTTYFGDRLAKQQNLLSGKHQVEKKSGIKSASTDLDTSAFIPFNSADVDDDATVANRPSKRTSSKHSSQARYNMSSWDDDQEDIETVVSSGIKSPLAEVDSEQLTVKHHLSDSQPRAVKAAPTLLDSKIDSVSTVEVNSESLFVNGSTEILEDTGSGVSAVKGLDIYSSAESAGPSSKETTQGNATIPYHLRQEEKTSFPRWVLIAIFAALILTFAAAAGYITRVVNQGATDKKEKIESLDKLKAEQSAKKAKK